MIRPLLAVLAMALAPVPAGAQDAGAPPAITFAPIAAPLQTGAVALPVASVPSRQEAWFLRDGEIGVRNVVRPTLTPVLPAGPSTGAAVIVAPGGAFLGLAIDNEGWKIARWLANHGIAAFVLKYRVLPTPASLEVFADESNRAMRGERVSFAPPADTIPEALADGLSALRHVRAHAADYRVDPERIGFMGFSAGGFLTRSVIASAGADMPAFAAPIYPRMTAMPVPANAPPLFVMIAQDDFLLKGVTGFQLVDAWRAAGKSVEFHLLADGGHGFGYGRPGTSSEGWLDVFHRWLGNRGMLAPVAVAKP